VETIDLLNPSGQSEKVLYHWVAAIVFSFFSVLLTIYIGYMTEFDRDNVIQTMQRSFAGAVLQMENIGSKVLHPPETTTASDTPTTRTSGREQLETIDSDSSVDSTDLQLEVDEQYNNNTSKLKQQVYINNHLVDSGSVSDQV
jgi:hypothetical protein